MAGKRVVGKEAEKLRLNFEVTREMFEESLPQLEALLAKNGISLYGNKSTVTKKTKTSDLANEITPEIKTDQNNLYDGCGKKKKG